VLTTYFGDPAQLGLCLEITAWLWLTVLFANTRGGVAEGRARLRPRRFGQPRRTKQETVARRLVGWKPGQTDFREEECRTQLTVGDVVIVERQIIPGDGDVCRRRWPRDESAITGRVRSRHPAIGR